MVTCSSSVFHFVSICYNRPDLKGSLSGTGLGRLVPKQTKPYIEAAAAMDEAVLVSELEIKKEAMNGFDRPGYCFYVDQMSFQMGRKYPLPDTLSTCHTLQEGGNGTILEVISVCWATHMNIIKSYNGLESLQRHSFPSHTFA